MYKNGKIKIFFVEWNFQDNIGYNENVNNRRIIDYYSKFF